jgi:hypothetical protein
MSELNSNSLHLDTLYKLPLPNEIICLISSYDRILSIKKLKKTDDRYILLKKIHKPWHAPAFSNINFTNLSYLYIFYGEKDESMTQITYTYYSHNFLQNDPLINYRFIRE